MDVLLSRRYVPSLARSVYLLGSASGRVAAYTPELAVAFARVRRARLVCDHTVPPRVVAQLRGLAAAPWSDVHLRMTFFRVQVVTK